MLARGFVPAMASSDESPNGKRRCVRHRTFGDMELTFQNCNTLSGLFPDGSKSGDSEGDYKEHCESRDMVLEDTGGAASVANSGPTTASAERTVFKKLVFACGDQSCACQGQRMYTLSRLMPTSVGSVTKDLCIEAYKKQTGSGIKMKAFVISVATMRAGEKAAVKVYSSCFFSVWFCMSLCFFFKCAFCRCECFLFSPLCRSDDFACCV